MSRRHAEFPWRVAAIAALLFTCVGLATWWIVAMGPGPATSSTGRGDAAGTKDEAEAAAGATELGGDQPTEATAFDPSRPEDRLALARDRAARGTMIVQLFLIVPGLERLFPLSREVEAPATLDAQAQRALQELIDWSGLDTASPLPPETRVRELWVSPGGIAYVDFYPSLRDFAGGGALGELHAVYGAVATLVESFPEIRAVQILIDGAEVETLAGHVDLSRPLVPLTDWVVLESRDPRPPGPNRRNAEAGTPRQSMAGSGGR